MAENQSLQSSTTHPRTQIPKGPVPVLLSFPDGDRKVTIPDPDELPRGLALSPSNKYLLRFIRENMEPRSPHQQQTSRSISDQMTDTPEMTPNAPRMLPMAENGHSHAETTGAVLGFDTEDEDGGPGASSSQIPSREGITYKVSAEFSPKGIKKLLKKVSRALEVGKVIEKREYRFHIRIPRPKLSPSKGRKKRLQRALRGGNPFTVLKEEGSCCKRYNCFQKLCPSYLYEEFKAVNAMNKVQAKRYLISLYSANDGEWYLLGEKVCSRFLKIGLGFSTDLQCQVKGTPGARAAPTAKRLPREVKKKTKRWYISNFILRLARKFAEAMPHKEEFALPVFTKTMLFREFIEYWNENIAPFEGPSPSKNYFFRVWKLYATMVKVQRRHTFTVCSRCEMLRSEMAKNLRDEETLSLLIDQFAQHLRFIERERDGYEMRQSMAEDNPRKYCSIILDGADQKNYGLPHFPKQTKSDLGHKLKVKVVGGLEHVRRGNEQLSLYAMTEEYATGANHVIEVAHRMLQRKKDISGKLPSVLFIQVDNCTRENKNRYFMAYFQSLIHMGVFKTIQISFLPIGHTHADIDQAFSSIATHLNINEAFTFDDLLAELSKCYAGRAKAFDLNRMINYSGLCDAIGCLNHADNFSEYRYFRFMQKDDGTDNGFLSSTCDVKVQETDQWISYPTSRAEGFLKFVPNLRDTPNTKTKELPNLVEVTKCLDSAEERVKDDHKMLSLRCLRDKVFEVREEEFHWNLETAFEMYGDYLMEDEETVHDTPTQVEDNLRANCGYDPDDLLAVETRDDENTRFWIARVKKVSEVDEQGRAKKLRIRWYVPSGNDAWNAKYNPAWKTVNGERTVYEDTIDVACILLRFQSLTTAKKLRVTDKKAIKQMLDAN